MYTRAKIGRGEREREKGENRATWWTANREGLNNVARGASIRRPHRDANRRSIGQRKKGQTEMHPPTVIVIDHAKSVCVPVTEELTANDVRVQPDQLQVFGVVTLVQHGRAALPIVHSRRCVTHDVNLKKEKGSSRYSIQPIYRRSSIFDTFETRVLMLIASSCLILNHAQRRFSLRSVFRN